MLAATMPGEITARTHTSEMCTAMPAPHPSDYGSANEVLTREGERRSNTPPPTSPGAPHPDSVEQENIVPPGSVATAAAITAVQSGSPDIGRDPIYKKGDEVWVYPRRMKMWEPGTVVETSFFKTEGMYIVTLRTGSKIEVYGPQVHTLTLFRTHIIMLQAKLIPCSHLRSKCEMLP